MPIPEHLANRDLDVAAVLPAAELPPQARVVIVGGGIIIGIAWWLQWPAYVMIFWTILTVISMVMQLVLMGVYATRT